MREWTCSYVVGLRPATGDEELRDLAAYLSSLAVSGCEVIVLDDSPAATFEKNAGVLRWVARHLPVRPEFRTRGGEIDLVRACQVVAHCEKVVLAGSDVRWPEHAIAEACAMLDRHEAVEPQEFLEATSWWSAVDAGWLLLQRGAGRPAAPTSTVALRRSALRTLRLLDDSGEALAAGRRLAGIGAEVFSPAALFVRRMPAGLAAWLGSRPTGAMGEFDRPIRTGFFLSLIPLLLFFGFAGGLRAAAAALAALAVLAVAVSFRGRLGASALFPLRTCLFAPLAVLERAVSVYWALYLKLAGNDLEERTAAAESAREARRASSR